MTMKFAIAGCIAALAFSFAPQANAVPEPGGVQCNGHGYITPNPYGKPIGQSAQRHDPEACPAGHGYYGLGGNGPHHNVSLGQE